MLHYILWIVKLRVDKAISPEGSKENLYKNWKRDKESGTDCKIFKIRNTITTLGRKANAIFVNRSREFKETGEILP